MKSLKEFFKIVLVISSILTIALFIQPVYASNQNGFLWGVNGHGPLNNVAYPISYINEQVQKAADLGTNIYRVNCNPDYANGVYDWTKLDMIISTCEAKSLKVYLVMYASLGGTPTELYNFGHDIAAHYGSRIAYYQMGNEQDNRCIISGDGSSTSMYDPNQFTTIKDKLVALSDGIDAGYTDAVKVINIGYKHTGFLQLLNNAGVDFEVSGLDWYSNMDNSVGDMMKTLNIMASFSQQSEVIIAECDTYQGTLTLTQQQQADYIKKTAMDAYYAGNSKLHGYIVYELLNENALPDGEDSYGLVICDNSGTPGSYVDKIAYTTYKNVIADIKERETISTENFDTQTTGSQPSGWTITNSGSATATVANVPNSYNKSLFLDDNGGSANTKAHKSFTAQSGAIIAEWKYKEVNTASYTHFQLKSGSNTVTDIFTRYPATPKLAYTNGTAAADSNFSLVDDTWHTIRVEANTLTDTYSIYAVGPDNSEIPIATNVAFCTSDITYIDGFDCVTDGSSYLVDAYVDDISITKRLLVNDNFDFITTGNSPDSSWSVVKNPASSTNVLCTVQAQPSVTDRSLFLDDDNTSDYVYITKSFTPSPSNATVTAEWIFKEDAAGRYPYFRLRDSAGKLAVELFVSTYTSGDYRLAYKSASGGTPWTYVPGNYTSNWYTIKIIANPVTHTFDVYVNGTLQVAGAPFRTDTGLCNDISKIEFSTSNGWATQLRIDDVKVYE